MHQRYKAGFTIVELLIAIVIIAIIATITAVAYNSVQNRAAEGAVKADVASIAKQLAVDRTFLQHYPTSLEEADDGAGVTVSGGNAYIYTTTIGNADYCLTIYSTRYTGIAYHVSNTSDGMQNGACSGHTIPGGGGGGGSTIADGTAIQAITTANCPTTRTRAVDARDNHTYWVQKLSDGKCWMLTNLGYAGGGTNTYGDVKALTNGVVGPSTYTDARYYVVTSTTNFTTEPTNPSTSTDGTGQYGYLYNWCGAMGGQSTSACANATTPSPNTMTSICPSGWRLPTGGSGGEFAGLNTAVNGGVTNSDEGLRANWLMQRGGSWSDGLMFQGTFGYYWSSSQQSATDARSAYFVATHVNTTSSNMGKFNGLAVRCIAL